MRKMPRRALAAISLICLISLGLSSCIVRRRLIVRAGGSAKQKLIVADRSTLLNVLARQYDTIRDFSATVDMVPALGSAEKSQITEYKDVRAFILFRKPDYIRLIGLVPVVRNKAFDMVSSGGSFKLYLPSTNRFIVGRNAIERYGTATDRLDEPWVCCRSG